MNAASFVEHASLLAEKMVVRESRGPGDTDNAMRRLGVRYGVPYQDLWKLRYRKPKEIAAHVYLAILEGYESQCETQERIYRRERETTKATGWASALMVRAADALAGQDAES